MMIKLKAEEALDAYNAAWRGESNAEISERYNTSKNNISQIKNGFTWSSITLHQRGKVPAFAQKKSFDEKIKTILPKPDVTVTIDDLFWILLEEFGSDIAYQFKKAIYEMRGLLRRKLTINEVEEIYDQLKNGRR